MLKKRILAAVLTFVLALTAFPVSVFASPSLDDQLRSRGYPHALIATMSDEEKQDIVTDDAYYESSTIYSYDENGNLLSVQSYDEPSITPYGTISSSSLTLRITNSRNSTSTAKYITFQYEWERLPLNRFKDPICVSWDENIFYMKTGSFRRVDQYERMQSNGIPYWVTFVDETSYSDSDENYVSWSADLKGLSDTVVGLQGYGKFTLVPKKKGQKTRIRAHYVHAKMVGSFSISYGGAGFTVSGPSNYDEMGCTQDITS